MTDNRLSNSGDDHEETVDPLLIDDRIEDLEGPIRPDAMNLDGVRLESDLKGSEMDEG